jgi:hypothetical protein
MIGVGCIARARAGRHLADFERKNARTRRLDTSSSRGSISARGATQSTPERQKTKTASCRVTRCNLASIAGLLTIGAARAHPSRIVTFADLPQPVPVSANLEPQVGFSSQAYNI